MRISIFLNNDLESNIALNCLLPTLRHHTFNLFLSRKIGGHKAPLLPLRQLGFLEVDFINQHLFPALKEQHNGFISFDQVGKAYNASLVHLDEITSQATLSRIQSFLPDLFISIRFGKIFKGEIFSIPAQGIINLHSAILPSYKGILGTFQALLRDEKELGTTIHYITDSSIDTGDIFSINKCQAVPEKSVLWHVVNLYPDATRKLGEIIDHLQAKKTLPSYRQPPGGNYYTFPTMDEIKKLELKRKLFDLTEYAELLQIHYGVDRDWVLEKLRNESLFQVENTGNPI